MMIKNEDAIVKKVSDKLELRIIARGGSIMTVEANFLDGGVAPMHTHPHEQISYVAEGKFCYTLDGTEYMLGKGDSIYIKPDAPHEAFALEDGKIVDVFSPQREEFLD